MAQCNISDTRSFYVIFVFVIICWFNKYIVRSYRDVIVVTNTAARRTNNSHLLKYKNITK